MGTVKDLTQNKHRSRQDGARSSGQDPHLLSPKGSPSSHQHAHMLDELRFNWPRMPTACPPTQATLHDCCGGR